MGEQPYLDLVREVIETGFDRDDRTGVGTKAKFAKTLSFDLSQGFPLLTTKKIPFRLVAEELLWFISGSTNSNELSAKNVHIWDANGSREYLDSIGLTERDEGDLGPVYGFQWRHSGAEYTDMYAEYTGQGVDQLQNVIDKIATRPHDRRLVVDAWNPSDLDKMALPPCHLMFQFFVADGTLSCMMMQRSADLGLGVPFNIASYALLTHMVASVTCLEVGTLTLVFGDVHVYNDHTDALLEQLERDIRLFPHLSITPKPDIDSFTIDDFVLEDYDPHPPIKMKMAL